MPPFFTYVGRRTANEHYHKHDPRPLGVHKSGLNLGVKSAKCLSVKKDAK